MSKEYSPSLRFVISRIAPRLLYKTKLTPEVNKQIKETKKFFKKNPKWNLIVAQDHLSEDDALFGGYIASRIDPKNSRYTFAPIGAFHIKRKEGEKKSKKVLMSEIVERCGVETIPVVQSYQLDNPEYCFTREDAFEKGKFFVRRMKSLIESKKPLTCIIMPEGHRSDDGNLGKAEKGIETIAKNLRPVRIISLGISSPDNLNRDKLNFGKRINLDVGEIIDCDLGEKVDVDDIMRNIAKAVPPEMRGQYGE